MLPDVLGDAQGILDGCDQEDEIWLSVERFIDSGNDVEEYVRSKERFQDRLSEKTAGLSLALRLRSSGPSLLWKWCRLHHSQGYR